MLRSIKRWLSPPARTRRPAPFRPALEALEDRRVLSPLATVTDQSGVMHVYAIDAATHQLLEWDAPVSNPSAAAQVPLATGPQIHAITAGLDPQGRAVVYARADDETIQERTASGGWFSLGKYAFRQVIGGHGGQVWALDTNGNVRYSNSNYPPGTWVSFGGPSAWGASRISVGADASGYDQVFAVGSDTAIYVCTLTGVSSLHPTYVWQLVDNTTAFTDVSATPDNQVYALDANGQLHQDASYVAYWVRSGFTWVAVRKWGDTLLPEAFTPGGTLAHFAQLSAGTDSAGHDVVYALDQCGDLVKYPSGGAAPVQYGSSGFTQVSGGTNGGLVYILSGPNSTTQVGILFSYPNSGLSIGVGTAVLPSGDFALPSALL
jgi:hypothetical protein